MIAFYFWASYRWKSSATFSFETCLDVFIIILAKWRELERPAATAKLISAFQT